MSYRLLTYLSNAGPRAGVMVGDRVFDAESLTSNPAHRTVLGVLEDWAAADRHFADVAAAGSHDGKSFSVQGARLAAPILYPGQILAAGSNYRDHIEEMKGDYAGVDGKKNGGRPWFFAKSSRGAVIGPDSVHPLPPYSQKVDWEIELAVVIGRTASQVSVAHALEHVAGYTIANDLSARDFVAREGVPADSPFRFDWLSHKGFDGSCPMGPWITPARDIPDPQNLDLKLWVDSELMQDSNTRHMIFTVAEQIEEISACVTLYPGDVVLTGTPSGVGMGRGVFLKPGQQLRLQIERIGELKHGFARADGSEPQ